MANKEFIAKNGLIVKGATFKAPSGFTPSTGDDGTNKTYVDNADNLRVPTSRKINNKALTADISITKSDVGLDSVDNTSDVNKPISNAVATALGGKEPTIPTGTNVQYIRGDKTLGTLNSAAVGLGNVNNVAQIPLSYLDNEINLSSNSDLKVPTQKAVKTYVDNSVGGQIQGLNLSVANNVLLFKNFV